MPFFSVIVPVYNVEEYISRCVESLLNQSYKDFEILLIDDGSKDNSAVLCDDLANKDKRISTYHKQNGGLASARNYGLGKAKGEYIVFCDSDDWVENNLLKNIYEKLKQNIHIDILKYGYKKYYHGVVAHSCYPFFDEGYYNRNNIEATIIPGLLGPMHIFDYSNIPVLSAWSCAYSRLFLSENKIQFLSEREYLNEDELFNIFAMLKARNVYVTHDTPYCYDTRDGSLTQQYMPYMFEKKIRLLKTVRQWLEEEGCFDKYEEDYYNYCVDNFYECIGHECSFNADIRRNVKNNIKNIMNHELFIEALHKCNHKNMSIKSMITYYCFKYKLAHLVLTSYRMITKRNPTKKGAE